MQFYTNVPERIPRAAVGDATIRGNKLVIGRNYFIRQATALLNLAQSTKDPSLAAALIGRAVKIKSQIDDTALTDQSPHAPDVERHPEQSSSL